ncbi:MAG: protoporphyrinogen oxidase [Desulforhopalus sp.]|jgi:oxygen-dependent protoporphyrinogen oxidase|nr:protoporphyrinogen oxidase [Desulforhopalus sp.]
MSQDYQTIILGGGLSGLTIAHRLRQDNPEHRLLLLDQAKQPGGVIRSSHQNGFIAEIGPHGFLDNCPESREILSETTLDRECIKAPLIDFVRYVYLHRRLNLIPQTPWKILTAPLIPWSAKLRVAAELWQPPIAGEPTVAKWISHRFGPALLPYLDAVYTGTYAGDFDRLSIDAVMPGVRALEKQYGSVLRGLIARFRQKGKSQGEPLKMPAMTSFPQGMQRLTQRLAEGLEAGRDLQLNTRVSALRQDGRGWRVETSAGSFTAQRVALALPINICLKLLAPLSPELPRQSIPQTWIGTVVFGFTSEVKLPPGFGFLTPEQEGRFALGTLFSSNMFPGRAPQGHILIETLVGGRRHPERLELDDATLAAKAFADVREILRITKDPVYTQVLRPKGGIPQLEQGYPGLLKWRDSFLAAHPGLEICGFGWDGIGINDMIKHAVQVAERLISSGRPQGKGAELKGVYF